MSRCTPAIKQATNSSSMANPIQEVVESTKPVSVEVTREGSHAIDLAERVVSSPMENSVKTWLCPSIRISRAKWQPWCSRCQRQPRTRVHSQICTLPWCLQPVQPMNLLQSYSLTEEQIQQLQHSLSNEETTNFQLWCQPYQVGNICRSHFSKAQTALVSQNLAFFAGFRAARLVKVSWWKVSDWPLLPLYYYIHSSH